MAYEKQTWVNGEVITDAKLNHMEDGIVNAGGFSVETETRVLVPEQNFTAQLDVDYYVAQLSNVQLNGESPIKVVFDGTEYTCDAVPDGPTVYYGDYDFVEYPFVLSAYQGTCYVNVADGNQHTISASVDNKEIELSEDFEKAVETVIECIHVDQSTDAMDKTWVEVRDLAKKDYFVKVIYGDNNYVYILLKTNDVDGFKVTCLNLDGLSETFFEADSADDYPILATV